MNRGHHPVLDILRGEGALLVLALHIHCLEPGFNFAQRGYLAVDFFFMLSGFVIGLRYDAGLGSRQLNPWRYLELRLIRLYPMILVGLALGAWSYYGIMPTTEIAERAAVQALVLPAIWLSGHLFLLNAPQWSLFFELVANAVHGFAARLLRLPALSLIVAASAGMLLLAIVYYGSADVGAERRNFVGGVPRVMFGFFGGLLLERLWTAGRLPTSRTGGIVSVVALPLVVLLPPALKLPDALTDGVIVLVVMPVILVAALGGTMSAGWKRLADRCGALSYPLYAIHAPLVLAAKALAIKAYLSGSSLVIYWIDVAFGIIVLSAVVERLYDRPIRALLRRLWLGKDSRRGPPRAAPSPIRWPDSMAETAP